MISENLKSLYEEAIVNINGVITSAADAKISIFDRGFLYGDSIYEVTYSQDSIVLFFDEHLDRLERSAKLIGMKLFISRDEIIAETMRTLTQSKIKDAYIRIIITRGETEITLDPSSSFKNNFVIIAKNQPQYPVRLYQAGIYLSLVSILKIDTKAMDPNAKSGNYLNNVLAIAEAKKLGADDAIMTNSDGHITEGTSFNIWLVKDGAVMTPPSSAGLLKGITRKKIINICKQHHIPLKIENFTADELQRATEVFITSSTRGIMPVGRVNNSKFNVNDANSTVVQLIKFYSNSVKEHKAKTCLKYQYGQK